MYYILFLTLLGNILFQDGCRAREKTTLLFQKSVCISTCCDNWCGNFRFWWGFFVFRFAFCFCFCFLFFGLFLFFVFCFCFLFFGLFLFFVFVFCFLVCFCCFSLLFYSNLVRTNNIHQVRSRSKGWKAKIIIKKVGTSKPKGLHRTAKVITA